jgi:hypothetical protein
LEVLIAEPARLPTQWLAALELPVPSLDWLDIITVSMVY